MEKILLLAVISLLVSCINRPEQKVYEATWEMGPGFGEVKNTDNYGARDMIYPDRDNRPACRLQNNGQTHPSS
ncbi:MAG: hypothetical protein U9N86_05710 [Bacteroidota bacterium]|nr:hypothetical protein [Bacteroidota bacterium]